MSDEDARLSHSDTPDSRLRSNTEGEAPKIRGYDSLIHGRFLTSLTVTELQKLDAVQPKPNSDTTDLSDLMDDDER